MPRHRELEINATTATKRRYVDHISRHLKSLNAWLRENFGTAFRITHKGVSKKASRISERFVCQRHPARNGGSRGCGLSQHLV